MMVREALVSGFSMLDFLSHPDILKNIGAQALGYGFGVLTNRPIEPIKLLPPLISFSYGPQAYDFVTQVPGATRTERIATLAYLLSGTGLLSKTGDPVLNAGAGSFIFLLAEYVEAVAKSGGGGNVPFIMARPNRSFRRFTTKQQMQCQLAITGILIITVGCTYVIILIAKKVGKFVKVKLKNALTKSSKIKAKAIIKLFKSKPKVNFIPLA